MMHLSNSSVQSDESQVSGHQSQVPVSTASLGDLQLEALKSFSFISWIVCRESLKHDSGK